MNKNLDVNSVDNIRNDNIINQLKLYFNFIRKRLEIINLIKKNDTSTNILIVSFEHPEEYILEMQKQYPNNNIRVLLPLININENYKKITTRINNKLRIIEKTSIKVNFFFQNKKQTAIVYKFVQDKSNIQIYGLYSPAFSDLKDISEFSKFDNLVAFIKATRLIVKKLVQDNFMPNIIQCENIPYYLGAEFEKKAYSKIKVLQIVEDFTKVQMEKVEPFWAIINLVDKNKINKICKDLQIKKCLINLFKIKDSRQIKQTKKYLNYIYKNYYKFRQNIREHDLNEENLIFQELNNRIVELFPQVVIKDDKEKFYYYPMLFTIKKCDYWGTLSKSYYNLIFENNEILNNLFPYIENTKNKSDFISYKCNLNKHSIENTSKIYQNFNIDNFRELRNKNKIALLKEFNLSRIKTNFVESTLFKDENNIKICGSLDSFYEAPLLFANLSNDIYASGIDILFNTIIKLFDLNKNIQVIIAIKNGLDKGFIRKWVDFLSQKTDLSGRWVFINSEINLSKFLAASDMLLLPNRINYKTSIHYLGMNYGSVPIANKIGIFDDSIIDIFDDISKGCGFKTKTNFIKEDVANDLFFNTVIKSLQMYYNNPNSWNLLIKNCLNQDSSWDFETLEKYNQIYKKLS